MLISGEDESKPANCPAFTDAINSFKVAILAIKAITILCIPAVCEGGITLWDWLTVGSLSGVLRGKLVTGTFSGTIVLFSSMLLLPPLGVLGGLLWAN